MSFHSPPDSSVQLTAVVHAYFKLTSEIAAVSRSHGASSTIAY
jgi:hypothetical protein